MMQWVLAGIVRHNAARVDDYALHLCALPIIAPPGDVISHSIRFCDVRLPPALGAAVPGSKIRCRGLASAPGKHCGSRGDEVASSHAVSTHETQKIYFSASCMTRFPVLLVIVPNDPLVGFVFALPQFG